MKKVMLLAILLFLWSPQPRAQSTGFQIIVNAANPTEELPSSRIAKIFLKQIKRWEDKTPITPIDQATDSVARAAFTRAIHGKKVSAIESFWQRQIFSGRGVPPEKQDTDQAVIDFVRSERGAIGYVSPASDLGTGVKELKVIE